MLQAVFDRFRLAKHFFSSARRRGLARTARIALYELWFERKLGVSTGIVIPVDRLDYSDEAKAHAEPYFPSSYLFLAETLSAGPLDCRDQVLVDFGCGMGRVLLFASTLPFKRIVGVELSNSLCEVARRNLNQFYVRKKKSAPEWSVVNADVRAFVIPHDATVFYMANPFDAIVVKAVLDNIEASLQQVSRQCYLIYANPQHETLLRRPGFRKLSSATTDYAIYSIVR
jgi:predicted RNA methylase